MANQITSRLRGLHATLPPGIPAQTVAATSSRTPSKTVISAPSNWLITLTLASGCSERIGSMVASSCETTSTSAGQNYVQCSSISSSSVGYPELLAVSDPRSVETVHNWDLCIRPRSGRSAGLAAVAGSRPGADVGFPQDGTAVNRTPVPWGWPAAEVKPKRGCDESCRWLEEERHAELARDAKTQQHSH